MARPKGKKNRPKPDLNEPIELEVIPYNPYELSKKQEDVVGFLGFHGYRIGQKTRPGIVSECIELFGISKSTLFEWLKIGEFRQKLLEVTAQYHGALAKSTLRAIEMGSEKILDKMLDVYHPEIWDRKLELLRVKHEQNKELLKLQIELKALDLEQEDRVIEYEETRKGEILASEVKANDSED